MKIKMYLLSAVKIIISVYIITGLYLYFNQKNYMYFPDLGDPSACEFFKSTGAQKITSGSTTLYHKQNGETLLVFYHGNAGTACDRKFLADFFNQLSISYVFVEYAGYGDGAEPNKATLEKNVLDTKEYLEGLSFNKFVLMSESLGAGLASYHATLRAPDKMILVAPYTSMAEVAAFHYWWYPVKLLLKDNYKTDFKDKGFNGELLVIHGKKDDVIPFKLGEKVFNNAPFANKKSLFLENAGHNDIFDNSATFDEITSFLTP